MRVDAGAARERHAAGIADEAFGELYRTHRDRLRRVAYLMTGQAAVAEDIVQDAFVRVHGRMDRIDNPPAYLKRTVVNMCLTWRKRSIRASELTPRPRGWVDPPELDEAWALLQRLPQEQRVAMVLRYYEGLPDADIALVTGCPTSTVRSRIHRGLNTLRKVMTS